MEEKKPKLDLNELKTRFPGTPEVYLEAIVENLEEKDWDVLNGVKDKLGFLNARKRLDLVGLSNYDLPGTIVGKYDSKGNKEEKKNAIDYFVLKSCVKELIGNYNEKGTFVVGGIAQNYLKAEGLQEEQGPETNKVKAENFKKRKAEAKKLYDNYKTTIDSIFNEKADLKSAKYLIDQLANENLENRDKSAQRIKEAYKAIPSEGILSGEVVAEVWKRDPSVDMSYSNIDIDGKELSEFYCCAFLGGCNSNAAPIYLRNGALSMLDFKAVEDGTEKRFVRAITGACIERKKDNSLGKTYMLVDSVEGSDRISDEIIFDAITSYAKSSGFDRIMFSNEAGNNKPNKFLDFVKRKKTKKGKARLQLLNTEGSDYLEAFNSWSFPAGETEGYVIDLRGDKK